MTCLPFVDSGRRRQQELPARCDELFSSTCVGGCIRVADVQVVCLVLLSRSPKRWHVGRPVL
jgi:hypothetical protein